MERSTSAPHTEKNKYSFHVTGAIYHPVFLVSGYDAFPMSTFYGGIKAFPET